jgi:uncharacterized membrane protein YeaQ/YmgE (transglycosylase-associated protein family)
MKVLVRQAVAREVEDGPDEQRLEARPAGGARGSARCDMERDDHDPFSLLSVAGHVSPRGRPGTHLHQSREGAEMGIIAFIILGLLAGLIAKAIMPGDDPGGYIVTAIIGVAGALLGGFLAGALFGADPLDEFFDISSWLTAIVGSIILLGLYRVVVNRGGGHGVLRT